MVRQNWVCTLQAFISSLGINCILQEVKNSSLGQVCKELFKTYPKSAKHNEELVEKTSVSESVQNQNIECFLIISKGNNLNLGLFNSQTKIFDKTTEIFGDFTV